MEEIRQLVESMTDEAGMVDAAALLEALAEMELSKKEAWQEEKKEFLIEKSGKKARGKCRGLFGV